MNLRNRQGDVGILPITVEASPRTPALPRDASGRVILAAGEVTGHHHAILDRDVTLHDVDEEFIAIMQHSGVSVSAGDRVLKVGSTGATVVHEEHDPHALPAGQYLVRIQHEYQPAALPRRVAD